MNEIEKKRLFQITKNIPDFWKYKKILYVGANHERFHFWEEMKKNCCKVWVVEIDKKECDWLIRTHLWLEGIFGCDIKDFKYQYEIGIYFPKNWETLLWSHGVSVLSKNAGIKVIKDLESLVTNLSIHLVPYGKAGGSGNVSVWYPKDFEELGYHCDIIGSINEKNSNLLAWKYVC